MSSSSRNLAVWGRYLAVAGAYAACYELTRNVSFSHWMLPAGLRMACLFLVPRRYWVALAVGETLPIAEMAALHASAFGTLWALVVSFPPIALMMPVVGWMRGRFGLFRGDGQIHMGMIMSATMICAAINGVANGAALANVSMRDGSEPPAVTIPLFLAWFLGAYLGALTLTPMILALRERLASQPGRVVTLKSIWQSTLTRDALLIAVPALALLMAMASVLDGAAQQCARMAMAMPVVMLTLRHGWHGTAIGGMLASIALASTSFVLRDPAMIQAQVVLAFVISTSLLFGVRVARRLAASHTLVPHAGSHRRG
ncbi:MAG TPA: MASE1 domain-containing protein [Luteibacter sp.]|uniref:MASE1 domain-containing protein n=1 Tax=Luteibacter sp. TaxID=1886636 RepID=UPI002CE2DE6F|nr:MASE1 domain-containing protein [Luteibacter sp.]HVI54505.1 MASE1 domain-containing protein [Luteibacter sp.]